MSIPWQSMTIATRMRLCSKAEWAWGDPGGGGGGRPPLEAGSSNTNLLFKTKVIHFSTLFNTRDFILWPWFVSFCIQNWVISRAIMGFMALGNFSSKRHGIGFLRYWNVNTVYRQPSHSLKRLRSVQKGTLFKTPNSENVSTPCLRLKPLKIIPCSAVHTRKSQIRKCPPPSPRELILAKAIHN